MFALGLGAHLLVRNSGKKNHYKVMKTRDRICDQARIEQEKSQHSWKRKVKTAEISVVWKHSNYFSLHCFSNLQQQQKKKKKRRKKRESKHTCVHVHLIYSQMLKWCTNMCHDRESIVYNIDLKWTKHIWIIKTAFGCLEFTMNIFHPEVWRLFTEVKHGVQYAVDKDTVHQ